MKTTLIVICTTIFVALAIRFWWGGSSSTKFAKSYTLSTDIMTAQRTGVKMSESSYKLKKSESNLVQLVYTGEQVITFTFDPSTTPHYGTCVNQMSGQGTHYGLIRLTPNQFGGYTFAYWEENNPSALVEGVLHPNWY